MQAVRIILTRADQSPALPTPPRNAGARARANDSRQQQQQRHHQQRHHQQRHHQQHATSARSNISTQQHHHAILYQCSPSTLGL